MSLKLKLSPLAAAAALVCASLPAHATNGYFLPGFGVQSMSMGGTGIASGTDSLSAGANPANLSWVGMRGDFDLILFNPNRYAKTNFAAQWGQAGPTTYEKSDNSLFEFPNLGFAMPLTNRLAVGLAFLANGGMNTTYRQNFYAYQPGGATVGTTIGIDLMQLLIPLSVSFKPTETQSVGISLIPALQRFRARGLQTFGLFGISSDPNHLTNQGAQLSYGFGARVGWIGHFVDNKVDLGATYATKIYMSKIGGYKGLFAGEGSFDIPANYGIGLALHPNEKWTLAFDITRIMYADIASVGNRGPGLVNATPNAQAFPLLNFGIGVCTTSPYCLGYPNGLGFGWKNQTVYKLGLAYKLNQQWTLKAGYNYAHSPIPNDQIAFNTLAPATVERHYSAGFTWKSPTSPLEVSGFYMRAPSHEQCGSNLQVIGSGCIKMDQNYLGVSLGWDLGG